MIATTISQSKHLLELGLDVKSADMCLCKTAQNTWVLYGYIPGEHDAHTIPAWSLSALLDVISKVTCISYLTIDTSYLIRCKDLGFLWQKDIAAKDPITATYKMVCWLLEQGFIKKGGEQ